MTLIHADEQVIEIAQGPPAKINASQKYNSCNRKNVITRKYQYYHHVMTFQSNLPNGKMIFFC